MARTISGAPVCVFIIHFHLFVSYTEQLVSYNLRFISDQSISFSCRSKYLAKVVVWGSASRVEKVLCLIKIKMK